MRKLTFDEVSSVTSGAVEIAPVPEGMQFFKFVHHKLSY